MNPLLIKTETPFETIPFPSIKEEHFLPALQQAIKESKENLEKIKNLNETPGFYNVIESYEKSGHAVGDIASIFFNLHSANTNETMQKIAKEFSPLLSHFKNDVLHDAQLFKKIKEVYEKKTKLNLSTEEMTLLEETYKEFVRGGALLNDDEKNRLRDIDNKLSQLSLHFGDNVLAETNNFELHVESESDLKGLPKSSLEEAKALAQEKGKEGYIFTLQFPSYMAIVTYAQNRQLREKMAKAMGARAFNKNEHNNTQNIKEIATLRYERAKLLGYKDHAAYVLEERMAEKPETVLTFLKELKDHSFKAAQKDVEEVKEYARKLDKLEDFKAWDYSYYAEKLKKEKFHIDDETLRPYFKLENVVDGVFKVARKLYGLKFLYRRDISTYHDDVKAYEVQDEKGKHIGVFYTDFFPRSTKRGGAWMTVFKEQKNENGKNVRPHISIVCNFTKPTKDQPSLLTFDEVLTLFHEFGHALHGLLSDVRYRTLAGTSVYWDFVELPSQILENWAYEKECLDLFAEHYETGEKIPKNLIEKIKESAHFQEGRSTLRQLSFAFLDMAWHMGDPSPVKSVSDFEDEATRDLRLLPKIENSNLSCSFSHIFQGGYSAGYYSYKWAEVLDADAFEFFKEKGIFNRDVSDSFKENILSKGGSEHPMDLYVRFRGHRPDVNALLRRAGLVKN